MRASSWNPYLTSSEFPQQFQVSQNVYYTPSTYIQEHKRLHRHFGPGHQNLSSFEPLNQFPYSNDIAFAPIEVGNNSGISGRSDANSITISNSDGAPGCPTSTTTREKSKNAARMRRSNENCEYKELSHYLPLPSEEKIMLDKASSIRLTTNFLKMRALLSSNQRSDRSSMPKQTGLSIAIEDALDGFLLILCSEGSVLYIGDAIKSIHGLSKWEITGTKFLDLVKSDDQEEFLQNLRLTTWEESKVDCINKEYSFVRRFVIRIKCLLSKSKNSFSCEGYKGHIKATMVQSSDSVVKQVQCIIGVARTLPVINRISMEVKLSRDMFMFRAGLDLKLSFVDDQFESLTGHLPKNVLEKSLYGLIHCGDAEEFAESHKTLLDKGQVIFKLFRLLCLNGGWVWVQAYAIILRGTRVYKPDFIVGFANILTGIQAANMTFDVCQLSVESGRLFENDIVPNKVRRKRRCPVSDFDEDSTPESYSIGDAILTERFTSGSDHYNSNNLHLNSECAPYNKAHEPATFKRWMNKDVAYSNEYIDDDKINTGNLPSTLAVHSFVEQLSVHTSATSNNHENWLYPLNFNQQY